MTGFGKSDFENDVFKIEVVIKSLNSKGLDLKIKFDEMTAEQEMEIRKLLSSKLNRGKIDCVVSLEMKNKAGNYKINDKIFDKYFNDFEKLNKKYETSVKDFNFYRTLFNLPEVIEAEDFRIDEDFWITIKNKISDAAENLDEYRIQEGKATETDFVNYITEIDRLLQQVPDFEQERIEIMKNKLKNSLDESNLQVNSDRFESELIYYIEKFDINEEKSRLKNHLKYFIDTMQEKIPGKKLNFISQEMGREINTLGSKANHFEIQKIVVSMKEYLEKIKEQVLNVL